MIRTLIIMFSAVGLFAQLLPYNPNDPGMDKEGVAIGQLIVPVLLQGPNPERYSVIAHAFLEDSRPFQSAFFFEQALKLDPKSEELKKGLKAAKDRLTLLEDNYRQFKEAALLGSNPADYCSMASIRFHQGYPQSANKILDMGMMKYGNEEDLLSLRWTYSHGVQQEEENLNRLEKMMQEAILNDESERAALLAGRMISIGLGKTRTIKAIKEFRALYPDQVKKDSVDMLAGMTAILAKIPELGL